MSYDNTNQGAIWRNTQKNSDTDRDFKGTVDIDGVEYWVSGWSKKKSDNPNSPSVKFKFTRKDENYSQQQQAPQQQAPQQQAPQQQQYQQQAASGQALNAHSPQQYQQAPQQQSGYQQQGGYQQQASRQDYQDSRQQAPQQAQGFDDFEDDVPF